MPWHNDEPNPPGWNDIAQICLNGHVINSSTKEYPQFSKKFCKDCGAATITQCVHCNAEIQGTYHVPDSLFIGSLPMPAFCSDCGSPYPWTESKLQAARELANELDGLSPSERESLAKTLDDLVKDTPNTPVAATRFKKIVAKTGKEGLSAFRDILVDIVSET